MKNYLTEWKKYLINESVESAESALETAKAKLKAAQEQKKAIETTLALAQSEVAANQNAVEQEKKSEIEASKATSSKAMPATTSPVGTMPTKMEEESVMSVGGRQDGAVGEQPVSVQEEELTEEEIEEASGWHEGMEEGGKPCNVELEWEEMEEEKTCNECKYCKTDKLLTEAKYKGRTVPLGKPMRGDVKKFKVYVRDPKTGNVKKVNFGDKKMRIKKSNPKRRKSFRARHHCANPGPRTKARYWSCRKW